MSSVTSSASSHDIDVKMASSSLELRKANKPLMEKRRRARINKSLNELKSILVESTKRTTPGHSKWEKADILEMTVSYLHCLRNQQKATRTDPLAVGQFIAGFSECVRQIQKYSSTEITMDREIQQKLNEHLLSYLKTFSDDATRGLQNSPTDSHGDHSPRSSMTPPSPEPSPVSSMISEDSNHLCNIPSRSVDQINPQVAIMRSSCSMEHESQSVMLRRRASPYSRDVWRPW